MPRFNYVALDARGQESVGVLEAGSANDVVAHLRQSGFFPTSVVEEGKGGAPKAAKKAIKKAATSAPATTKKGGKQLFQKKTVKGKTLMIFTRQLATLIDAGLPLLRGLTVLAKQEKDLVLKGGELGSVLELVLNRLAEFQEKAQKIKNKVVSAMFYPVVVLFIAIAIMAFLLVFIVPKFEQIFHDMLGGRPLPSLTQFVIDTSNILKNHIFSVVGVVIVIVVGYNLFARTASGRVVIDKVKLRMPLFGDLIRKSSISRFSRTLGTLVTSGVPILQALNIT